MQTYPTFYDDRSVGMLTPLQAAARAFEMSTKDDVLVAVADGEVIRIVPASEQQKY